MTGLVEATNVPRSTSIQRKSLPTCTLSLASVSAHTGKFRMAVDLPHHTYVQANVVPFPSVSSGGGGSAHALLRSSQQPPPARPRPRISTSVTSSIRRKRSASRITSPSNVSTPPTPKPPRKRARTASVSKSILKPTTAPASTSTPRRAPPADVKINACVYHTIFSLGLKRRAAAAGKRRASATPRCTFPSTASPRSTSPRFDDSDDSGLDSEIEEELETAVHHAILEEQDIMLSLRLRCFLLKNGIDPRGLFFQQEKEEREEEMGIPDPFLKDPNPDLGKEEVRDVNEDEEAKDMDVEVESGTPSVPSSATPVALRNAPPPPCTPVRPADEARVHLPSDLPPPQTRSQPTRTISTSPPRPSSASLPPGPSSPSTTPPGPSSPPRPTPKLKPAPPPSHLTAILVLRHSAKERQRYRSILAQVDTGEGRGIARGEKSPLRSVFSPAEEEEEEEQEGDVVMDEDDSEGSDGSVLEDVLMAMMVEDSESEGRREGMDVDLDA